MAKSGGGGAGGGAGRGEQPASAYESMVAKAVADLDAGRRTPEQAQEAIKKSRARIEELAMRANDPLFRNDERYQEQFKGEIAAHEERIGGLQEALLVHRTPAAQREALYRPAGATKAPKPAKPPKEPTNNAASRLLADNLSYASFAEYERAWPGASKTQRDRLAKAHPGYAARLDTAYAETLGRGR